MLLEADLRDGTMVHVGKAGDMSSVNAQPSN